MSKENTIVASEQSDGTLLQVMADGTRQPLEDKTDWARLRAASDQEVTAAASDDPDAQPWTAERIESAPRSPRARIVRRALGLTQEEFAATYRIPLGTLRDWEQGRCEPDQPAQAYLTVIARDPEGVRRALAPSDR